MVPVPASLRHAHSSRLLYTLLTLSAQHVQRLLRRDGATVNPPERRSTRFDPHTPKEILFVILIPVLVLLSGVFAGLTLGYMSLDETQLNVLSISGTPKQKEYANRIKPVRKNGHLLLVTLLLANMIVNETLPVIADPVLGGGVPSVVVSTVLIVIFAEIIPQSLFTRHGLYLGAKMAGFTQVLIYAMGFIAWPVAKFLEFVLGRHHGIIYRRAELKELIAMHSSHATHGGDLKIDTVTIIGATLDLQEKVVKQAMTPISDVFMLSVDSKLDYNTLTKVCGTGHSRIPVYEEVDVLVSSITPNGTIMPAQQQPRTQRVKKIVGILLVKQCVLLDPKDATPLRNIRLNKVPFVPNNEPLLGILDKFQEGRSHMAIVSRFSVEKAASVKKAVKQGLSQRLRKRVGMDTDSDTDSSEDEKSDGNRKKRVGRRRANRNKDVEEGVTDDGTTLEGDSPREIDFAMSSDKNDQATVVKFARKEKKSLSGADGENNDSIPAAADEGKKSKITTFQLPAAAMEMASMSMLEQRMPADAVLAKENAEDFLQNFDPAVMPLGIITLEDVLEELIGEEIYDEFDPQGAHGDPYEVPADHSHEARTAVGINVETVDISPNIKTPTPIFKPMALKGLGFLRSRSAPPVPRDEVPHIENNNIDPQAHGDVVATTALTLNPTMESQVTAVEMPQPLLVPGDVRPVVAEQPSVSFASIGSSAVDETKLKPVATDPINLSIPLPAMSAVDPRSTSPIPSLEAILLDRKRRLAAASSGNSFPSVPPSVASSIANLTLGVNDASTANARPVGSMPKGTRFKSSPLITGKSEVVGSKDEKGSEVRKDGGEEEGRISNEMEKSGPDIPELKALVS